MAAWLGDGQSRHGHWLAAQGISPLWTWKSRHGQCGRPGVGKEIRQLIRRMTRENPLWGAPKIHGELLKLGINISESTAVSTWWGTEDRLHKAGERFWKI